MRRTVRLDRGDPVVVRFLQTLLGPTPGQQTLTALGQAVAWHMRTAWLGYVLRLRFVLRERQLDSRFEFLHREQWTKIPAQAKLGRGTHSIRLLLKPHSESQVTLKLPSLPRDDGTASFAPALLTITDSCTPVPKLLIAPDTEESVAESVMPVLL
jgi:hypothetical protein